MQSERNKAIEWIPFTFDENGSIDYYLDYADELEGLTIYKRRLENEFKH